MRAVVCTPSVAGCFPTSVHAYKYRLFDGTPDQERVRYDNERGKGDRRHIGGEETAYVFSSIDQLLDDFENDIQDWFGLEGSKAVTGRSTVRHQDFA